MTLQEFAERINNLRSGGMQTEQSALDRKFLYSLIHTASAKAKENKFIQVRTVHPDWLFPYYPIFDEQAQISACYYRFKLPQMINLGPTQIGLGYVGSTDCNCQYRVVRNRAKFASMQQHKAMKNMANTVLVGNGYVELYGDAKELMIEGCWFDVTQFTNYNIEKDNYPISAELIPDIEAIIMGGDLNMISKTPVDTIQNMKDNSALNKQPIK